MSAEVFISYARKDRNRVLSFVGELRAHGVSAWVDEGNIGAASLWAEQIVEAIKSCKILILMVSEGSTSSSNVLKEITLASELEKKILPVYLEPCEIPDKLKYQLIGIQHIELHVQDEGKVFRQLLDSLDRAGVGRQSKQAGEVLISKPKETQDNDATTNKVVVDLKQYRLRTYVGLIVILFSVLIGFTTMGGHISYLFHISEIITISGFVFGALIFSFGFRPTLSLFLAIFGYKVPRNVALIERNISICDAGIGLSLFAGFVSMILTTVIIMGKLGGDMAVLGAGIAAAMSALLWCAILAGMIGGFNKLRNH